MVQRAVIILALLCGYAQAVAPAAVQEAWRGLLLDIRDRGLAIERASLAGHFPLEATNFLLIGVGTNAYSTNCWTNGAVVACATNYRLDTLLIGATNMVASTPTNLTADLSFLPAAFTQSFASAELIKQADDEVLALYDSGLFVDLVAIAEAGGMDAYFDTYVSTNWYWLDTDFSSASGEPGDTWQPFPQHPISVPIMTISNAFRYEGLEAVPTAYSVTTNSGREVLFGWQVGDLHTYSVTNDYVRVVTNVTWSYRFPRAPSNVAFRAEVAQARIEPIAQHVETTIVAGVERLVTVTTAALAMVARPTAVPGGQIPRLWADAGARAYFTGNGWTTAPAPELTAWISGVVRGGPPAGDRDVVEAVSWLSTTSGVQLANAFATVAAITSAWRGTYRSDGAPSPVGSSMSVIFTGVVATIGDFDGFHQPMLLDAWSQRVAIVSHLRMTRIVPDQHRQATWQWMDVHRNDASFATNWSYLVLRSPFGGDEPCDPDTIVSSNQVGHFDAAEACGPDGLVDQAFTIGLGASSRTLPALWWSIGAERACSDLLTADSIRYWAGQPWWFPCPKDDWEVGATMVRSWTIDSGDELQWRSDVQLQLYDLWAGASSTVSLVASIMPLWQGLQFVDRVGGGGSLPNGAGWPYDDQRWGDLLWADAGGFTPEPAWPASISFSYTDWLADSTNDLVLAWETVEVTNTVQVSDPMRVGTNRLYRAWTGVKDVAVTDLLSGVIASWPTNIPSLPFVVEYAVDAAWSGSYFTNYNGVSYEGRSGSRTRHEHVKRELSPPTSEGLRRRVDHLQVLFDWQFIDRTDSYL